MLDVIWLALDSYIIPGMHLSKYIGLQYGVSYYPDPHVPCVKIWKVLPNSLGA